jgi:hypothetical protein
MDCLITSYQPRQANAHKPEMKTLILAALASLLVLNQGFAQDTILKISGDSILSTVIEVTSNELRYKRFDNQDGPIYSILPAEVSIVRYQNGTVDTFGENSESY